ncbi:hypothetical protein [Lachnotalea sp. AF33-28]|jgi:cytochrome c biogenesis protein CcdA|uniref:hypothetical protein n=1 Tax=Lachnotalea sp. AF33-28 TaxID=2292046 RepID=UPI000E4F5C4C|nr:hypothetical protein [Lachnotalea sp. AF33-28]RHP35113.1 hypothetical protein DWZ56_06315 [Lachnotalea sp. AF33-28]
MPYTRDDYLKDKLLIKMMAAGPETAEAELRMKRYTQRKVLLKVIGISLTFAGIGILISGCAKYEIQNRALTQGLIGLGISSAGCLLFLISTG